MYSDIETNFYKNLGKTPESKKNIINLKGLG
jgi:hypothetical protein